MRRFSGLAALALAPLAASGESHAQDGATEIAELYLGQKPPGSTPEPFAPGIISTEGWECCGAFAPDMKELYVRKADAEGRILLVVFRYRDGQWHESLVAEGAGQPTISPDGTTMHLGGRYRERTEAGWSATKDLGPEFADFRIMRLTASSNGTYYFDEVGNDGDGRIRYSRLVDGEREAPRLASQEINTGSWLAHPFIAPDESYILFDGRRDGGFGDSDIYVSFRRQDGSWGTAINLGDRINTNAWEAGASVTSDGKYLLFNRNMDTDSDEGFPNVDVLWVDAQVIEDLRPNP